MVVIIDPHLKRTADYPIYKTASELGVLVKNKDNNEFEGWCWTGSSSWIDFFHPGSWDWWIKLFRNKKANEWTWTESTESTYIWHDMNEVKLHLWPLFESDFSYLPSAVGFQWSRNNYAQRQYPLRRLGTSRRS
jgi:alpha-glucosidase (family GH31 glycosyl hydrolase)